MVSDIELINLKYFFSYIFICFYNHLFESWLICQLASNPSTSCYVYLMFYLNFMK